MALFPSSVNKDSPVNSRTSVAGGTNYGSALPPSPPNEILTGVTTHVNGNEDGLNRGLHYRRITFPLSHSSRQKVRRWPLALRFIKGSIHHVIILPVVCHTLFTALIVYLDQYLISAGIGVPPSIIPSISIVVGLMLVFRNSSSYERFWGGRCNLQTIVTSTRNLTRSFLVCGPADTPADKGETEKVVKTLLGILLAMKNHLRGQWGVGGVTHHPDYMGLLPQGICGHEMEGVGLALELAYVVERYIKRGVDRGYFNAPQSAMLTGQLNCIIDSYGKMETIKLTPIPVCQQIHQKQVLALYCCVLPFCLVDEMGWLSVPIMALVSFTLYGIEGIGEELEDPFGQDKNDIKLDAIIEDLKEETLSLLESWRKGGEEYQV